MRRMVVTILVSGLLVAVLTAGTVLHVHDATCASQNRALTVLQDVLQASLEGQHRFNSPTDIRNRVAIYDHQVAEIRRASCR